MRTVQRYLDSKQHEFRRHPFITHLEADAPVDEVVAALPRLCFWVMVFQDVLRLNEGRVIASPMRRIARHHRGEDAGHDIWFLADLDLLGEGVPDVRALFGPKHASTRDAGYALMAEVFRARRDHERVVLLLALESIGHIFFEAIASYFERAGMDQPIRYFSRHHIDIEKSHEVFEQKMEAYLASIELSDIERRDAVAMIDRVHIAFRSLFDGLSTAKAPTRLADAVASPA